MVHSPKNWSVFRRKRGEAVKLAGRVFGKTNCPILFVMALIAGKDFWNCALAVSRYLKSGPPDK